MAARLARLHGTEEDTTNCPYYFKVGACRHGDKCSRNHNKPNFSQTLLLPHVYFPPLIRDGQPLIDIREHFEDFWEEMLEECTKFGTVEDIVIVENEGEHMLGNVYVKYSDEEEADAAKKSLTGRYYGGRLLEPEYSCVTEFRDGSCRQHETGTCNFGTKCNFMHMHRLPRHLMQELREVCMCMC